MQPGNTAAANTSIMMNADCIFIFSDLNVTIHAHHINAQI